MDYQLIKGDKNNPQLIASFNELTNKVFGFDFINWEANGYWMDQYIPYFLVDGEKVISNVSVNMMC